MKYTLVVSMIAVTLAVWWWPFTPVHPKGGGQTPVHPKVVNGGDVFGRTHKPCPPNCVDWKGQRHYITRSSDAWALIN